MSDLGEDNRGERRVPDCLDSPLAILTELRIQAPRASFRERSARLVDDRKSQRSVAFPSNRAVPECDNYHTRTQYVGAK